MNQRVHFYQKHLVAKAAVEGGDVLAICGTPVEPVVKDGRIVSARVTSQDQCGRCYLILRAKGAALKSRRKKLARDLEMALDKGDRES